MNVEIEQARDIRTRVAPSTTKRLDYVAAIEAAYRLDLPDEEWIASLLSHLRPALDCGLGVFGWFFHEDLFLARIRTPVFLDTPLWISQMTSRVARLIGPELWRAVYLASTCTPVSKAHTRYPALHHEYLAAVAPYGIRDQVLVRAYDASHTGVVLSAHSPRTIRMNARRTFCLSRVAAHIAAAYRLRRHTLGAKQHSSATELDAVLEPGGRVLHAEGNARERPVAAALSAAAREMERSRSSFRHREPEGAVALWRALVAGRWSLVETVERDGKRFVLAQRNAPGVAAPTALSPPERRVAALMALARPQKLIAYELGLSEPTVAQLARRALGRLGLRSRAELAALFAAPPARPRG